jgi:hypothetical protein
MGKPLESPFNEAYGPLHHKELGEMIRVRMRDLLPTLLEWKRSIAPTFRGSILGFLSAFCQGRHR